MKSTKVGIAGEMKLRVVSLFKMPHNYLWLCDVAEKHTLIMKTKFDIMKESLFENETAIAPNRCYALPDLWNGNAVEILKTIQSETIDLIVTDPPYKIITGGGFFLFVFPSRIFNWKRSARHFI